MGGTMLFCVVLLVSGTLCLTQTAATRNSVPVTLQRPEQPEAALLGGFFLSSDDAFA